MKTRGLFLAVFLAGAAMLAASQNQSQSPSASPSNDQGASANGNDTYESGAHQQAPSNSSPTANASSQGLGAGSNANQVGSPNASHTSNPGTERAGHDNSSTNPSTVNPGNGNSPSSTPPGAGGSNTGGPPQMNYIAYPGGGAHLQFADLQQQSGSTPAGQNSAGQSSPSDNSVDSTGTPAPPSPAANNNAGLQSRINDALRNEPTLGASHVVANVTDNGIELSGTVGSTKDKQTAERIASSFDGNRKLTDNISVTGAGHSDLAPNHPAMNNGGVGDAPNPATSNPKK